VAVTGEAARSGKHHLLLYVSKEKNDVNEYTRRRTADRAEKGPHVGLETLGTHAFVLYTDDCIGDIASVWCLEYPLVGGDHRHQV